MLLIGMLIVRIRPYTEVSAKEILKPGMHKILFLVISVVVLFTAIITLKIKFPKGGFRSSAIKEPFLVLQTTFQ